MLRIFVGLLSDRSYLSQEQIAIDLRFDANQILNGIIDKTEERNLLRGMLKFCDRVKKYKGKSSRLSSSFNSFASQSNTSLKITATAVVRKARKGKIYVQPEAVKRRKVAKNRKLMAWLSKSPN